MKHLLCLLLGFATAFLGFILAIHFDFVVGLLITFGGVMTMSYGLPNWLNEGE
tara:strand:+ start:493 stop:651 length:159 start_codon:yes stop_codon:yes gene_type:complete